MLRPRPGRQALVAAVALLVVGAAGGRVAAVGHPAVGPPAEADPRAPHAAPVLVPIDLGPEEGASGGGGSPASSASPSSDGSASRAAPTGAPLDPAAVEAALVPAADRWRPGPRSQPRPRHRRRDRRGPLRRLRRPDRPRLHDEAGHRRLGARRPGPGQQAAHARGRGGSGGQDAAGRDRRGRGSQPAFHGREGRRGGDEPDSGVPRGARRSRPPAPWPCAGSPG